MPEIDGWNTAKTYHIFYPESVVACLLLIMKCVQKDIILMPLDLFQNKIWSMN